MASKYSCSIGHLLKEELNCDKHVEITIDEKQLVIWRVNQDLPIDSICNFHKNKFIRKFEDKQNKCCNPFHLHAKARVGGLRVINQQLAKSMSAHKVVPGQKLCIQCRNHWYKTQSQEESSVSESDSETDAKKQKLDMLDKSFELTGMSPVKRHGKHVSTLTSEVKRKVESLKDKIEDSASVFLGISKNSLYPDNNKETDLADKAKCFDELLNLIKDKMTISNNRRQIQLLTLAPQTWSISKVAEVFKTTHYKVKKSRQLMKEKGLLGEPEIKKGKVLSDQVIQCVGFFYQDNKYSRILPGTKDCVSVGNGNYEQKRLILCNLRELYEQFKLEYPMYKIGFSSFCNLRPKWCVIAGASGTHSVCVCSIHQNAKLLVDALPVQQNYKDLMKLLVCNDENYICMIHRCEHCPDESTLRNHLSQLLANVDEVQYKQWQTTDRCTLLTHTAAVEEFMDLLVDNLQKLCAHSYLSKTQSNYLRSRKENLEDDVALILGDFSENFKFVVQDEVQGFHWTNSQCTLHPVVIYFKSNGSIAHKSFCILSDDMTHDVFMVYEIQSMIVKEIKMQLPHIKHVEYYSDGCAAQYKNKKNFKNLCCHQEDFGLSANWVFFATSHGKSPCDGIGGTVKRAVSKESLQNPMSQQILSCEQMLQFCHSFFSNIEFLFIPAERMDAVRESVKVRFEGLQAIPGTRSFHHFVPVDKNTIKVKRCSEQQHFDLTHSFSTVIVKDKHLKSNQYVACVYDAHWWIGVIQTVNESESDANILFMHPHGPSRSFKWPSHADQCLVPFSHILCSISTPTTVTGRQYVLSQADVLQITNTFADFY